MVIHISGKGKQPESTQKSIFNFQILFQEWHFFGHLWWNSLWFSWDMSFEPAYHYGFILFYRYITSYYLLIRTEIIFFFSIKRKKKKKENCIDIKNFSVSEVALLTRKKILNAVKNSCLPKLICELNAAPNKENLSQSEISLLNLIRWVTI